jgi:hypothetical protein
VKITDLLAPAPWIEVTLHNGAELRLRRKPFCDEVVRESAGIAAEDNETGVHIRARKIAVWIAEWDVVDEDGKQVPPSVELLAQLDLRDLNAIDNAMGADFGLPTMGAAKDGTTPSETSDAGSSPVEN